MSELSNYISEILFYEFRLPNELCLEIINCYACQALEIFIKNFKKLKIEEAIREVSSDFEREDFYEENPWGIRFSDFVSSSYFLLLRAIHHKIWNQIIIKIKKETEEFPLWATIIFDTGKEKNFKFNIYDFTLYLTTKSILTKFLKNSFDTRILINSLFFERQVELMNSSFFNEKWKKIKLEVRKDNSVYDIDEIIIFVLFVKNKKDLSEGRVFLNEECDPELKVIENNFFFNQNIYKVLTKRVFREKEIDSLINVNIDAFKINYNELQKRISRRSLSLKDFSSWTTIVDQFFLDTIWAEFGLPEINNFLNFYIKEGRLDLLKEILLEKNYHGQNFIVAANSLLESWILEGQNIWTSELVDLNREMKNFNFLIENFIKKIPSEILREIKLQECSYKKSKKSIFNSIFQFKSIKKSLFKSLEKNSQEDERKVLINFENSLFKENY